ncbi:hypothetical protein GCM10008955_40810 [Deinococcus malanensis]|uniref:Uncharacterized protein n=1 Tax=Deinococcus malanensis TaxID=1706855 RepID=A0ABQ2F391_9DEIO|nr:hypothetical protein GCM10008955_40810 [Deinococcus malanensis]
MVGRASDLSLEVKYDEGEQRWASLVNEAAAHAHFEPDLWPAYKAAYDAHYAFYEAVPRFSKAFNEAVTPPADARLTLRRWMRHITRTRVGCGISPRIRSTRWPITPR